jgi:hypothetical protein
MQAECAFVPAQAQEKAAGTLFRHAFVMRLIRSMLSTGSEKSAPKALGSPFLQQYTVNRDGRLRPSHHFRDAA